jgi:hypothetical protein
MDVFERLFGWSPDGGNGALELLLFLIPFFALTAFAMRQRWLRKH